MRALMAQPRAGLSAYVAQKRDKKGQVVVEVAEAELEHKLEQAPSLLHEFTQCVTDRRTYDRYSMNELKQMSDVPARARRGQGAASGSRPLAAAIAWAAAWQA